MNKAAEKYYDNMLFNGYYKQITKEDIIDAHVAGQLCQPSTPSTEGEEDPELELYKKCVYRTPKELLAEIASLKSQLAGKGGVWKDVWHDVNKELPPTGLDDDAYWLIHGCKRTDISKDMAGHEMIASYNPDKKRWETSFGKDVEDNPDMWGVTHWTKLPLSPADESPQPEAKDGQGEEPIGLRQFKNAGELVDYYMGTKAPSEWALRWAMATAIEEYAKQPSPQQSTGMGWSDEQWLNYFGNWIDNGVYTCDSVSGEWFRNGPYPNNFEPVKFKEVLDEYKKTHPQLVWPTKIESEKAAMKYLEDTEYANVPNNIAFLAALDWLQSWMQGK